MIRVAVAVCAVCGVTAAMTYADEYGEHDSPLLRCTAEIRGTEGDDTLIGTGRSDLMAGLGGDDQLRGKGRRDCIGGGAGDDVVLGGGYGDHLKGGPGRDRLKGGLGDDRIRAVRGGRDRVECDRGEDVATVDELKDTVRGCELVKTP